jgi:tRNA(adenine34) deaminase
MTDKDYLLLARKVAGNSKEKVPCGCVIVQNGKVIAKGFNSQEIDQVTTNHAEIKAIRQANDKLKSRHLKEVTAYCSCEPCVMCLTAFSYAKVKRIVFENRLIDLFPNDQQSKLNSQEFIKGLNFVPQLEQLLI